MCCGGRICMLCTCVVLIVVAIGFLFGFGVFKNGFHKLKDSIHVVDCLNALCSSPTGRRPFLGFPPAPSPSY
uniref:Uncharacterized protein n=2 Tax=Nicotiana TaxID=4085 RepID=A0A1S3XI54_TOBAC|nr:PREDICTED: uncharacterized protein LOC104227150 [Nicotiana sylvestris]XP_016439362.1 PREDICTED: uncharacterized protein LOC107765253 [Nicotiana tabacum]